MPPTNRVVLRFNDGTETTELVIEQGTMMDALAQLAREHPTVGPSQITWLGYGDGGKEVAYGDWRRQARTFYLSVPFLEYDPPDIPEGEPLSIRCPRCGFDIGDFVETALMSAEIHLDLTMSTFEFSCDRCGSDLEEWLHSYFNGLWRMFDEVFGTHPERTQARTRVIEFYQTLQRILADLASSDATKYHIAMARVRAFEMFDNEHAIATRFGLAGKATVRRMWQSAHHFIRKHTLAERLRYLFDLSGQLDQARTNAAGQLLDRTVAQVRAELADVQVRQTEVIGTLNATIATLRAQTLVLRGLNVAEAETLATTALTDLKLTATVTSKVLYSNTLKDLRSIDDEMLAGELLIRLREYGRTGVLAQVTGIGKHELPAIEAAYARLGVIVFNNEGK